MDHESNNPNLLTFWEVFSFLLNFFFVGFQGTVVLRNMLKVELSYVEKKKKKDSKSTAEDSAKKKKDSNSKSEDVPTKKKADTYVPT